MLDILLWFCGAVAILVMLAFVLPMMVYLCVRMGTAAYFNTKKRFLNLQKDKCDECQGSTNRKNISGSEEGRAT